MCELPWSTLKALQARNATTCSITRSRTASVSGSSSKGSEMVPKLRTPYVLWNQSRLNHLQVPEAHFLATSLDLLALADAPVEPSHAGVAPIANYRGHAALKGLPDRAELRIPLDLKARDTMLELKELDDYAVLDNVGSNVEGAPG